MPFSTYSLYDTAIFQIERFAFLRSSCYTRTCFTDKILTENTWCQFHRINSATFRITLSSDTLWFRDDV